jgi:hypothetical protein
MTPLPTDMEILDKIYERYYVEFRDFEQQKPPTRKTKTFVPIDIIAIARSLNVDPDIVFGRLYYHLAHRYNYEEPDGSSRVSFFEKSLGRERDVVHFPYMASVLADLRAEHARHEQTNWWSFTAAIVSVIAILVSIFS